MAVVARHTVSTLADLIVAAHSLITDARIHAGRQPADVELRKPVTITLTERTVGDGHPRQVLTLDIR